MNRNTVAHCILSSMPPREIILFIIFFLFVAIVVFPPTKDADRQLPVTPLEIVEIQNESVEATSTVLQKPKEATPIKTTSPPEEIKKVFQTIQKTLLPLEELNQGVKPAIVNILCESKASGSFSPLSGSGVIIDSRGVVVTNAHVAQYLLLRDYPTKNSLSCIGRTGSPATPAYTLDLLFIPESWVTANASMIQAEEQLGTGENDYALLIITGSVTNSPLPENFTFVTFDESEESYKINAPILLTGYPAGFLGGIEIQKGLWLTASPAMATKFYYFTNPNAIDAFSMPGNIISQKGSSGGAAVSQETGKVLGIISTVSDGKTTEERDLTAITFAHINRSIASSTGMTLRVFLGQNLSTVRSEFYEKDFPVLSKKLTDVLEH